MGPKVSLEIPANQVTALLGHNGAGKTTLMSIITGLFPPSDGDILIDGLSVRTATSEIHSKIGLCPQFNVLWPALTVNEHLVFSAGLHGISSTEAESEICRLLELLNLGDKRYTRSAALSGGMKRKLSVAMAYMGDPSCVILDEPTAGMVTISATVMLPLPTVWRLIRGMLGVGSKRASAHLGRHTSAAERAIDATKHSPHGRG